MNGLYIAKKQLRGAGILDISFSIFGSFLLFIFAVYHFGVLIPNGYSPVNSSEGGSSNSTIRSASGIVSSKGYSGFFNVKFIDFLFFKVSLWNFVLILFIAAIFCFITKVVLGSVSLYQFFKGKSIRHIYAAVAVIFLPCGGGIVALNTYRATTSRLAPKYVASNSSLRFRFRGLGNNFSNSNTFKPETKNLRDA